MGSIPFAVSGAGRTPGRIARLIRHHTGAVVGVTFVVLFVLAALFLPLPYDPLRVDGTSILERPSADHWFGTDGNGADVYSRVVAAARLDIPLALGGSLIAAVVGVFVGLAASRTDRGAGIIMRGLDIFQSFPLIVLAIAIVALTGNDLRTVVFAIVMINAPMFVRLVRADAMTVRSKRYVEAAIALGASQRRVSLAHVLPNVAGTVLAQLSLSVGSSLLAIASLSFIGVGLVPPTASWGAMIRSGAAHLITGHWWVAAFPGAALVGFVVAFSLIADSVSRSLQGKRR